MTDLLPPADEVITERPPQKPRGLGITLKEINRLVKDSVVIQFEDRLSSCIDTNDIHMVVDELGLDIRTTPAYSQLAFEHLLRHDTNRRKLLQFLEDPIINPPAAGNLLTYIQHLRSRPLSTSGWIELCRYVEQAVVLGSIPEAEIKSILGVFLSFATRPDLVLLPQSIWAGFQGRGIGQKKPRGPTLNHILRHLSQIPVTEQTDTLVKAILASATLDSLRDMRYGASSYLVAWVLEKKIPELDSKEIQDHAEAIPELIDLINGLPRSLATFSVASATMSILSQINKEKNGVPLSMRRFRMWMASLFQSTQFKESTMNTPDWQAVERRLMKPKHYKYVNLYLENLSDVDQSKLILRNWVGKHVEQAQVPSHEDFSLAVRRTFDELCQSQGGTECYSNIVLSLYLNRQPYDQVLHDILWVLRNTRRPEAALRTLLQLNAHNVSVKLAVIGAEVERYSLRYPRLALRIYEMHEGLKLEGCLKLAYGLINDPFSHVDTTLRLLDRHQKSARSMARLAPKDALARSRLLHNMATAFAHASHLNPQVAFRKVYRCYLYLRKHRYQVRAQLIRALNHAGIVRNLAAGDGVSVTKIKWILSKVQEVEGNDVERVVNRVVYRWRGQISRDRYRRLSNHRLRMVLKAEINALAARHRHVSASVD